MTATRGCRGKVEVRTVPLLFEVWDVGEGADSEGMVDVAGDVATSLLWGSVNGLRVVGGLVEVVVKVKSGEMLRFGSRDGRA